MSICNAFRERRHLHIDLILLRLVPRGPLNNKQVSVHIIVWYQTGDQPLSELTNSKRIHVALGLDELDNTYMFLYVEVISIVIMIDTTIAVTKIGNLLEVVWTMQLLGSAFRHLTQFL